MNLNMIIEEFLKAYENCSQEPDQWERLALALEERGIPTLSGEQWTPATTSKFFQEHVAGQAEHQSRLKRFVSLFNVSSSELKGEIAWAEMARRLNDAGIGGPNREEWTGDSARDFYERWAKPEMETTYGLEGPLEARSEDAPGPSGDDPSGGKVVPIFASESARKKVEEKRQALPVPVKPVVTVYVEVQGSSESITTEIKGLLKAELQSLGEIEITDKNPKWRIVAMATMRQGSMDVAFMYVVSETLDLAKYVSTIEGVPVSVLSEAGVVYEHLVTRGVLICHYSAIEQTCKDLIANFGSIVERSGYALKK